eukprot:14699170-Alexandrium_andersonii.AAC.1
MGGEQQEAPRSQGLVWPERTADVVDWVLQATGLTFQQFEAKSMTPEELANLLAGPTLGEKLPLPG